MLKKYAMVCINTKGLFKRRVLIQYNNYKDNIFYNTRIIDKDPYFYREDSSHKYEFYDDGYKLISLNSDKKNNYEKKLLNKFRPYHSIATSLINSTILEPILILAESDEMAITFFKDRKEIRIGED